VQSRVDPAIDKDCPASKKARKSPTNCSPSLKQLQGTVGEDKKLTLDGWEAKLIAEGHSHPRPHSSARGWVLEAAADPAGFEAVFRHHRPLLGDNGHPGAFADQVKDITMAKEVTRLAGPGIAHHRRLAGGADKIRREIHRGGAEDARPPGGCRQWR